VSSIKFFFPGQEIFNCNRGKGSKFRSLKYFYLFGNIDLLYFIGPAFDQKFVDPISGLLNNVKDNRLLLAGADDLLYFFNNVVNVVPSNAGDGFELIFKRSKRVLFGILEHEVDLVLHRVALERFAQDIELVGSCLFDYLELIEIDILQSCELILL